MYRRIRLNDDAPLSIGRRPADMHDRFVEAGGPIGHVLKASLLPRLDVPLGHSPDRVFPLPAVLAEDIGLLRAQCVTQCLNNDAVAGANILDNRYRFQEVAQSHSCSPKHFSWR